MLDALRLRNFRSLRDTGEVKLRPIVLLVGANSSGKSSFLRFFPLLRQTAEAASSAPLLWYRDQGYVDFGDFRNTLFRGAERPVLEVDASMEDVRFTAQIEAQNGHSRLREFHVEIWGHTFALTPNDDGSLRLARAVNGEALVESLPGEFIGLMPELRDGVDELQRHGTRRLKEIIWERAHGNTTDETLEDIADHLRAGPVEGVRQTMAEVEGTPGTSFWTQNIRHIPDTDPYVRRLQHAAILRDLGESIDSLRGDWGALSRGVRYIGPFRSDPERFYRKEEIAVGEIARRGDNLAMFMHSLSRTEGQEFSAFVREHFGFGVSASVEGSHVVLKVDAPGASGPAYNLVDMGYGISQLLPIVAQCWIADRAVAGGGGPRARRIPSILAIEQPELHLHPHHQYQLADMFAGLTRAFRGTDRAVPLLIETHSEAMIHRFGELVEQGAEAGLSPRDITVLLFEKRPESEETIVRQTEFDADGVLKNWPLGFFRR